MLEEFAKSHSKIDAIYQGHNPEEEIHKVYYFLVPQKYDKQFEDEISDLDFDITNKTNEVCSLMVWPCEINQTNNYPFLGKCIWKRK